MVLALEMSGSTLKFIVKIFQEVPQSKKQILAKPFLKIILGPIVPRSFLWHIGSRTALCKFCSCSKREFIILDELIQQAVKFSLLFN